MAGYRPDVLTDPAYWTDEPIDDLTMIEPERPAAQLPGSAGLDHAGEKYWAPERRLVRCSRTHPSLVLEWTNRP
jgi:hypothetical protein